MRALVQRVSTARVYVESEVIGEIDAGLLVLVCAMKGDSEDQARALAAKVAKLRIFKDADDKMNLSVRDINGAALVVSQFTLAADTSRGTRPGFSDAVAPELGRHLYETFAGSLSEHGVPVETGAFGANMQVHMINDGPVTIWLNV